MCSVKRAVHSCAHESLFQLTRKWSRPFLLVWQTVKQPCLEYSVHDFSSSFYFRSKSPQINSSKFGSLLRRFSIEASTTHLLLMVHIEYSCPVIPTRRLLRCLDVHSLEYRLIAPMLTFLVAERAIQRAPVVTPRCFYFGLS